MDTKKKKFKDLVGPPKSLKKYSYGYTDKLPRYGYLGRNNPKGLESKRPDPYEGMTEEPPHRGGGEYDWAKEAKASAGEYYSSKAFKKDGKAFRKENKAMRKGKSLTDVLLEKDKKKKEKEERKRVNKVFGIKRNKKKYQKKPAIFGGPGKVPQG